MKIEQSEAGGTPMATFWPAPRRSHQTLWDGTAITVRDLGPAEFPAVLDLAENLSGDELYLRFFAYRPKYLAQWAHSVTELADERITLGAFDRDTLLAVGNYVPTGELGTAEIAIVVAHDKHRRSIATTLLKQLGEATRKAGMQRLVADVLTQNHDMRKVIADSGWLCTQHHEDDVISVEVDLTKTSSSAPAVTARPVPLSAFCTAR